MTLLTVELSAAVYHSCFKLSPFNCHILYSRSCCNSSAASSYNKGLWTQDENYFYYSLLKFCKILAVNEIIAGLVDCLMGLVHCRIKGWTKVVAFWAAYYMIMSPSGLSVLVLVVVIWGEKPTSCYTTVYWTFDSLNMFQAPSCPSSGAWGSTDVHSMWHVTLVMAGCRCGVWL
jgi:hypothetical protein